MVVEIRRYLRTGSAPTSMTPDPEDPSCPLPQISSGHQLWYDSLEDARSDLRYEDCSCVRTSGRDDRASVGATASAGTA